MNIHDDRQDSPVIFIEDIYSIGVYMAYFLLFIAYCAASGYFYGVLTA